MTLTVLSAKKKKRSQTKKAIFLLKYTSLLLEYSKKFHFRWLEANTIMFTLNFYNSLLFEIVSNKSICYKQHSVVELFDSV